MKLVALHIHSFGCLKNFELKFNDGLNTVCEFNGYGKSTVAAFIKAMLYGMEASRNKTLANDERARFRPWNSTGKFGGTLTFETGGRAYRIERMFGETPKYDDAPAVYDCATNKRTNIFGDEIGVSLLQLDAEDFIRCLYVPQDDIKFNTRDNFRAKINALTENSDESNSFASASKKLAEFSSVLKKEITKIKDSRIRAELDIRDSLEKEREIDALKIQLKALSQSLEAADGQFKSLEIAIEKQAKHKQFSAEFRRINDIRNDLADNEAELRRLSAKFPQGISDGSLRHLADDVERHKRKAEECAALRETRPQTQIKASKRVNPLMYLAGGLGLALLPAVLGVANVVEIWLGFMLAAMVSGAGAVLFWLTKKRQKQDADSVSESLREAERLSKETEESERILRERFKRFGQEGKDFGLMLANVYADAEKLREKTARRAELEKRRIEAESAYTESELKLMLQSAPADEDTERRLRLQRAAADEMRQRLTREIAHKESSLRQLVDGFVSVNELRDRAEQLKAAEDTLIDRQETAVTALEALRQAKDNLSAYFLPEMQRCLEGIFSRLTDGRFSGVSVDTDFNITVSEDGAARDLDYFSEGLKQVCVFCLRMAVVDTLFKKEPPFLLLDDPFVQIDTVRFLTVGEILRERAKHNQIIFLTCHEHAEAAVNCGQ